MCNFKRLSPFFVILVFLMSGATPPTEDPKPADVELRGNIVCLAEEMHTHYNVERFKTHPPFIWGQDRGRYILHASAYIVSRGVLC